eukprot:7376760-Prorocentrum_lima.AAC.1
MTSSLVGSEMCIRDSYIDCTLLRQDHSQLLMIQFLLGSEDDRREFRTPVSYTHLTLPTICSV